MAIALLNNGQKLHHSHICSYKAAQGLNEFDSLFLISRIDLKCMS